MEVEDQFSQVQGVQSPVEEVQTESGPGKEAQGEVERDAQPGQETNQ